MKSAADFGYISEARQALEQRATKADQLCEKIKQNSLGAASKIISQLFFQLIFCVAFIVAAYSLEAILDTLPRTDIFEEPFIASLALYSIALLLAGYLCKKLIRLFKVVQVNYYIQKTQGVKQRIQKSAANLTDIASKAEELLYSDKNQTIKPQSNYDAELMKYEKIADSYRDPKETVIRIILAVLKMVAGVLIGSAVFFYVTPLFERLLVDEAGRELSEAIMISLIVMGVLLLIYAGIMVTILRGHVSKIGSGRGGNIVKNLRLLVLILLFVSIISYPGYMDGWLDGNSPIDRLGLFANIDVPGTGGDEDLLPAENTTSRINTAQNGAAAQNEKTTSAEPDDGAAAALEMEDEAVPLGVVEEVELSAKKVVVIDTEPGNIYLLPHEDSRVVYTFTKGTEVEMIGYRSVDGDEWGRVSKAVSAPFDGGVAAGDTVDGWLLLSGVTTHKIDDMSDFDAAQPSEVGASMELRTNNVTYPAGNAVDGNPATAWQARNDNSGADEWILLEYDEPVVVDFIKVWPGYSRSETHYSRNARAKSATFEFSGNQFVTYEFDDVFSYQIVWLNKRIETTFIKMTIDEVYPGSRFRDLCISEISAYHKR